MRSTRFTVPTAEELASLARARQSDALSVLLPPLPAPEAHLTLRNLAKEAEQLLESSLRPTEAERRLRPVYDVLDDHSIWSVPRVALAMYLDESECRVTAGPEFGQPLAVVGPRFHVAHLLAASPSKPYAVLVLTRSTSHLYRSRRGSLTETKTGGLPAVMAEVLRYDDREPQLQSHGSARRGGGGVVASFHGQGDRGDHPEDVARYLRFVAAEVEEVLGGEPLVLAATHELAAAFRRVSSYVAIESSAIAGNAERTSPAELAERAETILAESEAGRRRADIELFRAAAAAGSIVTGLGEILTAAHDGRIARLALTAGHSVWGCYDAAQRRVAEVADAHEGVELANEAAAETWLHGGEVLATEQGLVGTPWQMAAMLRF